jgi:hypothetical protein
VGSLVRLRYGLPGCSPPCTYQTGASSLSRLPRDRSPPVAGYITTTANGLLVWALSRTRRFNRRQVGASFPSSVSLFDLRAVSSSRPALRLRWRAQKLSRLAVAPTLRGAPPLPGHTVTASSTTARFGAIGMTIGGEPACGRDQSRHNLVSGGSKDPNHDADPMQARRTGGVLPTQFLPSHQCIGEDSDGSQHSEQPATRRAP